MNANDVEDWMRGLGVARIYTDGNNWSAWIPGTDTLGTGATLEEAVEAARRWVA